MPNSQKSHGVTSFTGTGPLKVREKESQNPPINREVSHSYQNKEGHEMGNNIVATFPHKPICHRGAWVDAFINTSL